MRLSFLAMLCTVVFPLQLKAEIITIEFAGPITNLSPFISFAHPSDEFVGRFTYDTTTPETGDGRTLVYRYPTLHAPIEFTLAVNGVTFGTTHSSRLTYTERDFSSSPQISLTVQVEALTTRDPANLVGSSAGLLLIDLEGIARFGFSDPLGNVLSFSRAADFEDATFEGAGMSGPVTRLTLITPAPISATVPEPGTLCIFLSLAPIALGTAAMRRGASQPIGLLVRVIGSRFPRWN